MIDDLTDRLNANSISMSIQRISTCNNIVHSIQGFVNKKSEQYIFSNEVTTRPLEIEISNR